MKLIGALHGHSIVRVSPEEVAPKNGIPWLDLTEALRARYKFQTNAAAPVNVGAAAPIWTAFQNGEFQIADDKIAVQQLLFTNDGALVVTSSTESSDAVLKDLIGFLDSSFEFHISKSTQRKAYISDIVVQFEKGIEEYLTKIGEIENLINQSVSKPIKGRPKAQIKRIAFGSEASDLNASGVGPLDGIESVEFLFERRARQPYSENRYYCRAPIATNDHIKLVESIESVLSGRKLGLAKKK
jgi:hypothetical protein